MLGISLDLRSTAVVLAFSLGACASDGHVTLSGGGATGARAASDTNSGASDNSNAGDNSAPSNSAGANGGGASGAQTASAGTTERVVARAGNAGGALQQLTPSAVASGGARTVDRTIDPLARVSVGNNAIVGAGSPSSAQQIGLSTFSPTQNQGQIATLGVLANGQAASASLTPSTNGLPSVPSTSSLVGVAAQDQQVIGNQNNPISASVLSSAPTNGGIVSANALSGAQTAGVQVNGGANSPVATLAGQANGLVNLGQ